MFAKMFTFIPYAVSHISFLRKPIGLNIIIWMLVTIVFNELQFSQNGSPSISQREKIQNYRFYFLHILLSHFVDIALYAIYAVHVQCNHPSVSHY